MAYTTKMKRTTECIAMTVHSDGVTVKLLGHVQEGLSGDAREYELVASDSANGQFYVTRHDTLSKAMIELHRFNMAEFASSVYVTDDADEAAFAEFA